MSNGRSSSPTVLEAQDVRKSFGGLVALDNVDIRVHEGETVGIVGPNGAGKSTLFNCIMGNYKLDKGRIVLRDTDISSYNTSKIVKRGMSRTFQTPRVFPELTVRQNMLINQDHSEENTLKTLFSDTADEVNETIDDLLDFVSLDHLQTHPAAEISTGQQKLLTLGCTLVSDPEIVLLDEPTAGVNPALVDDIIASIQGLGESGTTFLIIEHDMDVIRQLSSHVYVLANGTNLLDAPPSEALRDERVLEAYFGE